MSRPANYKLSHRWCGWCGETVKPPPFILTEQEWRAWPAQFCSSKCADEYASDIWRASRQQQPASAAFIPCGPPEISVRTEIRLPETRRRGSDAPPSFSRRKNPRPRKAMAARREQGFQTYGTQRLGTLADVWPEAT